ncbi:alpha/beta fold hydrolase [Geobacter sp.]|uniref:alpha/beta fold hydrolase n=1 Tax=Geobacter sp. TaxID=46610 RepID=UPI0026360143|nr:alpha/beta fold hydrolase [Geobacter sp.]
MRTVINGITMAYDDHGSGPAVVLIHGFPLCRRMWHPQIQALTNAGFRVIAPDLRGFGESDAPDGPYSMELFADDIVELLDHLGIDEAVVGGMSMGGYVLLNLLERHRQRLRGAVFITTRATADDEAGRARRLQLAQEVLRLGPQVVADAFRPLLFAEASLTERPKLVAEVSRWMAATDSRGLAGGLLAMRERKDYTPLLGGFAIPALAIGAAEDRAAPPETARTIAAAVPGCRLCIVPEAGHLANLEHPGAFNDCLREFLQSL